MTTTTHFNPFEEGFAEDPYPQYRRLREADPVHQTRLGPVLLTRWADVHQLLRNPAVSVEDRNATGDNLRASPTESTAERAERGNRSILRLDPPDYTRLRRLVSKAFTPRSVARLQPRVEAMVDTILDRLGARGVAQPARTGSRRTSSMKALSSFEAVATVSCNA